MPVAVGTVRTAVLAWMVVSAVNVVTGMLFVCVSACVVLRFAFVFSDLAVHAVRIWEVRLRDTGRGAGRACTWSGCRGARPNNVSSQLCFQCNMRLD